VAVRRAAVLGSPIGHSLSPVLHQAAYRALGLTEWSYQAIECDEAGLPGLLASLGPEWAGLSLTMPLKRAVLPLLDLADPLVAEVGGANTVILGDGGRLGYNTDVPGMTTALAEAGVTHADRALVLGAGATACAALAALRGMAAGQVTVAVRNAATAGSLLSAAGRIGISVRFVPFGNQQGGQSWPLLISTVPARAADLYAERIRAATLTTEAVLDVVYDPWPTRLAAAAQQAGATAVGGFELLLHQAARQVELMTGRAAPVAAMRAAGLAGLADRAAGPAPDF